MAYPIESTGVSSRIQDGVEDNVEWSIGFHFIILKLLKRGIENQPWDELEAGLRIKFEEALGEFRANVIKR